MVRDTVPGGKGILDAWWQRLLVQCLGAILVAEVERPALAGIKDAPGHTQGREVLKLYGHGTRSKFA